MLAFVFVPASVSPRVRASFRFLVLVSLPHPVVAVALPFAPSWQPSVLSAGVRFSLLVVPLSVMTSYSTGTKT